MEKFDLFAQQKVSNAYKHKGTELGGALTFITWLISVLLIGSELFRWIFVTDVHYEFLVDSLQDHKLQINLDLIVKTQCEFLSVDLVDMSGNSEHIAFKLTPALYEEFEVISQEQPVNIRQLISGAHMPKKLNQQERWFWQSSESTGETNGCRIAGKADLNKVSGNVHITSKGHGYAQFVHTPHELMNFTHSIRELQFGHAYPGLFNPLDGTSQMADKHFATFSYMVDVIPTIYISGGSKMITNQYAYTQHQHQWSDEGQSRQVPGIFFKYSIEALTVQVTETRTHLLTLLVRIGAVLGGVTYLSRALLWLYARVKR